MIVLNNQNDILNGFRPNDFLIVFVTNIRHKSQSGTFNAIIPTVKNLPQMAQSSYELIITLFLNSVAFVRFFQQSSQTDKVWYGKLKVLRLQTKQ